VDVIVCKDKEELGRKAARRGADFIRQAVAEKGKATIILATGASQFEMLANLVKEDVDWAKVTAFHLDEYIGLPETHPASFRNYLKERFASKVPIGQFYFVNGEAEDPQAECRRLGELITRHPVDVAFVGIGENGHLAFNDPPADFDTEEPYLVVELDEACRRQQLGEGWFASLEEVPSRAISMSIRQILKSKAIICAVPDLRKAEAVKKAVEGPVTPELPSSILQTHPQTFLYLEPESASLLSEK